MIGFLTTARAGAAAAMRRATGLAGRIGAAGPSDTPRPAPQDEAPKALGFRRIGVVVPVYGHARFAVEALEDALASQLSCPLSVVAVDDGDPAPETRAALDALRARHAGRLHTVRRANGGLSAARNTGVRALFALAPDIDAVFFLDADNRLEPYALHSYATSLRDARQADARIGWAFPDVHVFGLTAFSDGIDVRETAGADTAFRHLRGNISEAGSLVHREVFEAGVWYDEAMRSGFEDWDFWLSAREAGFSGVRVRDPGFLYRVRPESMVAQSRRETERLLGYMRDKHTSLFSRPAVLRAEHEEAPRFLMADLETGTLSATSDPAAPGRPIGLAGFRDLVAAYLCDPQGHDGLPPILIAHQGTASPADDWPAYLRSLVFETTATPLKAPCLIQIEPGGHAHRVPDNARYARRIMERATALFALVPISQLARIVAEKPRFPGLAVCRDTTRIEHWVVPVLGEAPGQAGIATGPRRVRRLDALLRPLTTITTARPLAHVSRLHRGPTAGETRAFVSDVLCGYDTWPPFPQLRDARPRILLSLAPAMPGWTDAVPALHALLARLAPLDCTLSVLLDGQTRSVDLDAVFGQDLPANVLLNPGPITTAPAVFGYGGDTLPMRDPHAHPRLMALARGHDAVVTFGVTKLTPLVGEMKGDGLAVLADLPDALARANPGMPGRLAAYEHAHHAILTGAATREALATYGVPAARLQPHEALEAVLRARLDPS